MSDTRESKNLFSHLFSKNNLNKSSVNLVVGAPEPYFLEKTAAAFKAAFPETLEGEKASDLFQYGSIAGHPLFLTELANLLGSEFGTKKNARNFVTTNGATGGLQFAANVLLRRNAVVFLEEPTYFIAINILRKDMGIPTVPIKYSSGGIDIAELSQRVEEWKAKLMPEGIPTDGGPDEDGKFWGMIYVIPTYHNPTGREYSAECSQQLIAFGKKHGLLIFCDDVYNLLYYNEEKKPVPRLQDYEMVSGTPYENGNVLSNGTFSKILGPGLRVGWIEGPINLINILENSSLVRSSGCSNQFTSTILGYLLRAGAQSAILDEMRKEYTSRMAQVCFVLREQLPEGSKFYEPKGGYFIWIQFPSSLDMSKLRQRLSDEHNIVIPDGRAFSSNKDFANCTRLSIAFHPTKVIVETVKTLCNVAREMCP